MASIGLLYLNFATGESLNRYSWFLIIATTLFFYTVVTSQFVSRSALTATNFFASFIFACTLLDNTPPSVNTQRVKCSLDLMDLVKFTFLVITLIHALMMIGEYIRQPQRVTGLVSRDYSQASMAILIIFGLTMPILRDSRAGLSIVAVLYLGFFCAFSRSANFLLFLFLAFMYLQALQSRDRKKIKWLAKATLIIIVCYTAVATFPLFLGEASIDRGGLAHFNTLNSRTTYWTAAWGAIQQNLFWGYGLGTYEWSGIKELLPFDYVPNAHNDYLQVWLGLGIFWLLLMLFVQIRFMTRHQPFVFKSLFSIPKIVVGENIFIAWSLLFCVSLYMTINFIISFLFFQLLIVTLICEVLNEQE